MTAAAVGPARPGPSSAGSARTGSAGAGTGAPIEVRAPGKLFIAGEYAVVEPGQPSVLVALDRSITVRLTESHGAGSVLSEGSTHTGDQGQQPLVWTRDGDGLSIDRERHSYDYVMAVIELVERLRDERGIAPRFSDIRISSELDDASGRKFGLGSSAAVTVATVRALDLFHGLDLTLRERYQLALLATVRVNPTASGGDLAASTVGGWIRYSAPDRVRLLTMLPDHTVSELLTHDDAWEGLSITRLAAPEHLRLLVGWTGSPASTTRLVDVVQRHRDGADTDSGTHLDHPAFLAASRAAVDDLVTGLQSDTPVALDAITRARGLLQRLGAAVGSSIETGPLATLCDIAEAAGAAAKPSGAGGGDCGIVLVPDDVDPAQILRAWEAHDIRHLTLSVHPSDDAVPLSEGPRR